MRGKVVVLSGGTSGIGEAAALKLAEMGARLVLVARDVARAEATIKRLQNKCWRRPPRRLQLTASILFDAKPSLRPKRRSIGLWGRSYGRNRNRW